MSACQSYTYLDIINVSQYGYVGETMEDLAQLIVQFDARIDTPEKDDDIKELAMVRDNLVQYLAEKYSPSVKASAG